MALALAIVFFILGCRVLANLRSTIPPVPSSLFGAKQDDVKRTLLAAIEGNNGVTTHDDHSSSTNTEPFIVHYIHLQDSGNPGLSFTECMGLLSVMTNLAPDSIYLHTSLPDRWPFDTCRPYIHDWPDIQIINRQRKFVMNHKRIRAVQHEADIIRLEILQQYGGLALDFDVLIINGTRVRELMAAHPCIVCAEKFPHLLNVGFFGCQRGAALPGRLLERSYYADYRPQSWLYNSGEMLFKVWNETQSLAHVVHGVCNYPFNSPSGEGRNFQTQQKAIGFV